MKTHLVWALAISTVVVACSGGESSITSNPDIDAGPVADAKAPPPPVRDAEAPPIDAKAPEQSVTIPPSQLVVNHPWAPANQNGEYTVTLDETTRIDGSATMLIAAGVDTTLPSWAATTATIPVDSAHRSARYRIRAKVKTEGAGAGFAWFRIDKPNGVVIDNMLDARARRGDTPWTEVSLVLDVPPKAARFAFGSGLKGEGKIWIGPITLEAVDESVPVTGK